jgi:hypothetical protein
MYANGAVNASSWRQNLKAGLGVLVFEDGPL